MKNNVFSSLCFILWIISKSFDAYGFDEKEDKLYWFEDTSIEEEPLSNNEYFQLNSTFEFAEETIVYPCRNLYLAVIPTGIYRGGNGRSYRNGYEALDVFAAFYHEDSYCYPFFDGEIYRVDRGHLAFNTGLGFRRFSSDYCELFGINAYYDFRHFSEGDLHQIGLGLELFSKFWDFRFNGYLPVGKKQLFVDSSLFTFTGDFFARSNEYISAMWGFDLEIGKTIFCSRCLNLYAAAGPYYYNSRGCCNSIIGGQGRLRAYVNRYLSFGFYISYDRLFRTKAQGEVALSFPVTCILHCWKCLFPRVERNGIITADKICCWETNF